MILAKSAKTAKTETVPTSAPVGRLENWARAQLNKQLHHLQRRERQLDALRVARWVGFAALCTGFMFSALIAIAEIILLSAPLSWHPSTLEQVLVFVGISLLVTILELWLRIRMGIYAAARLIMAASQRFEHFNWQHNEQRALIDSLCRAVAGVPEPDLHPFDLNPAKYVRRHRAFLRWLFFRGKVVASKAVAKPLTRRLLARTGLRGYDPLIAAPITALWNTWGMQQVLGEVRFRLMARLTADALLQKVAAAPGSAEFRRCLLLLTGNRITLFDQYHQPLDYLIRHLHAFLPASGLQSYDDPDALLQHFHHLVADEKARIQRIALVLFAFKRRRLRREERTMLTALGLLPQDLKLPRQHFSQLSMPVWLLN